MSAIPAIPVHTPQGELISAINDRLRRIDLAIGKGGDAGAVLALGTHAARLALPIPADGSVYYETDRGNAAYQVQKRQWSYVGGFMAAAIAGRPTDLKANDAGFEFLSSDTYQLLRWSGSAWATVAPNVVRSLARNTVAQSIATGLNVALTFDTNVYDVGGIHSTSVNQTRFTAPVAGIYHAEAQVGYPADATAGLYRQIYVTVNGGVPTPLPQHLVSGTGQLTLPLGAKVVLAAGDYVEFVANHNAAGALNTVAGSTFGSLTLVASA